MESEPVEIKVSTAKVKKPRSTAQQEAFKAAVTKLKDKRTVEQEEKAQRKATLAVERVEGNLQQLKAKVKAPVLITPAVVPFTAPSSPVTFNSDTMLTHFAKILDEKLAHFATPPVVHQPASQPRRRKARTVESSESEGECASVKARAPLPVKASSQLPNAWYDTLFPRR